MHRSSFNRYAGAVIIGVGVFFISNLLLTWHYGGDQRYYVPLYEALKSSTLQNALVLQTYYTGSREPLYAALMWLLARFFEKIYVISLFNAVFASALYLWMSKNRASIAFHVLIFTNFYFIVLLTSAERLKFAYLFVVLAALSPIIARAGLLLMSLMSHFSIILLIVPIIVGDRYQDLVESFKRGPKHLVKSGATLLASAGAVALFYMYYSQSYQEKLANYLANQISEIVQALALFVLTVAVSSNRARSALLMFIPLTATYFLGGSRMNMISASIFIYIVVMEGRTKNPIVLCVLGYLSFKSIDYIYNIYRYGTGFLIS